MEESDHQRQNRQRNAKAARSDDRQQQPDQERAEDSAEAPRKVEKGHGRGGVFGGELRGPKVDRRIRETIAEAIDTNQGSCQNPRPQTKKCKPNCEGDETRRAYPGKAKAGDDHAGQRDAKETAEILRGEQKTGLRVAQRPVPRKNRQDRPKKRGDHTNQNEADVKQKPFIPWLWL